MNLLATDYNWKVQHHLRHGSSIRKKLSNGPLIERNGIFKRRCFFLTCSTRCTNRLVKMAPLIITLYTSHHVTVKSYSSGQQAASPFVSVNNVIKHVF